MPRRNDLAAADHTTAWIDALMRAVIRAVAGRRAADADDIGAAAVTQFLGNDAAVRAAIIARYPDAVVYGRIIARHAMVDHDRRQRVQRGEGARIFRDASGLTRPGRVATSGDATGADGAPSVFDRTADNGPAVEEHVVDQLDALTQLAGLLHDFTDGDRDLLLRIDGHGQPIIDVAAAMGIRRETLSRRLSRLRQRATRNAALMLAMPPLAHDHDHDALDAEAVRGSQQSAAVTLAGV